MVDHHTSRHVKRRGFNLIFLVTFLVVIQLGVYFRSSYIQTLSNQKSKFDSSFSNWYNNRSSNSEIKRAIAELKTLLQEREERIINLSSKLIVKEEEIRVVQNKILEWINRTIPSNETNKFGQTMSISAISSTPIWTDSKLSKHIVQENKTKCHFENNAPTTKKRRKKLISWNPVPGKYLLAMCTGGQFSNRLACIRQNMLDAALLNRTLIFPSRGMGYEYENLINLKKPRECFGNDTFLTLDEYFERKGSQENELTVDRLFCHVHSYQKPKVCIHLRNRFSRLGVKFNTTDVIESQTPGPWFKYSSKEFRTKFLVQESIIGFCNTFGVGGREFRFEGCGPLEVSPSCTYYLSPSLGILQTAAGFVNSFLGKNFLGMHMRRGDFFEHCVKPNGENRHTLPCFYPLQQLTECIEKRVEENPGGGAIFLATNGDESEFETLRWMLMRQKSPVVVVRLGSLVDAHWAKSLKKLNLQNDSDVIAMVEKTVCMFSNVFYGTSGSTFSGDINRLRDWFGMKSFKDSVLCPMNFSTEFVTVLE